MTKAKKSRRARGQWYELSLVSGPPGDWEFLLKHGQSNHKDTFAISQDYGLWLEDIVDAAYTQLNKRVGGITVIPSHELLYLFTDVPNPEKEGV